MAIDRSNIYWDFLLNGIAWDLSRPNWIRYCREHFEEKAAADPDFTACMREVALEAIQHQDVSVIRRGLIALAFVGNDADATKIEVLTNHPCDEIKKEAKTCLFELRRIGIKSE